MSLVRLIILVSFAVALACSSPASRFPQQGTDGGGDWNGVTDGSSGDACEGAACASPVTAVVPVESGCGAIHLAAAGGTVYWTDSARGTVNSHLVAGGTTMVLASNEMMPDRIRVNGSSLFWLSRPATIRRIALPDGAPADVVAVAGGATIADFVVSNDGQAVFFASGGMVMKVPATGGAPVEVVAGAADELAIEGNLLAYAGSRDVYVVTLEDGVVASCGAQANGPGSVNCVDSFHEDQAFFRGEGLVLYGGRAYACFGLYVSNLGAFVGGIQEIAGDPFDLFMIDGAGDVEAVAFGAYGPPMILARGQTAARSLAVDKTNVYWTSNCGIYSVSK